MAKKLLHTFEVDLLETINWDTGNNTGSIFDLMIDHGIYELGKTNLELADRLREKDVRADAEIIPPDRASTNPKDYILKIKYIGELKQVLLYSYSISTEEVVSELTAGDIAECGKTVADRLRWQAIQQYMAEAVKDGRDPHRLKGSDITVKFGVDAWDPYDEENTEFINLDDSEMHLRFYGNEETDG
jgi:hypothetical protein